MGISTSVAGRIGRTFRRRLDPGADGTGDKGGAFAGKCRYGARAIVQRSGPAISPYPAKVRATAGSPWPGKKLLGSARRSKRAENGCISPAIRNTGA